MSTKMDSILLIVKLTANTSALYKTREKITRKPFALNRCENRGNLILTNHWASNAECAWPPRVRPKWWTSIDFVNCDLLRSHLLNCVVKRYFSSMHGKRCFSMERWGYVITCSNICNWRMNSSNCLLLLDFDWTNLRQRKEKVVTIT